MFKKKKIYEYDILEKVKIDIDECMNPNSSKHEYCKEVARDSNYIFYCYQKPCARFYGYILRQEIHQPKNVVFFGRGTFYNVVYENHLFQVNDHGELGDIDLTARNITTGRLTKFDWIGQRALFYMLPEGFGRFYNQDKVNDVFIEDGKLIIKGSRKKSNDPINNPQSDEYDVTGDFTLVVEKSGTGFSGKFYIEAKEEESKEDNQKRSDDNASVKPAVNSSENSDKTDNNDVVSMQRHKVQEKKHWLDENGIVRCPGDACPIECDINCPIYAQTMAFEKLGKEDFDGAAKLLRIATSIEPSFADAWNNLAACYGQMGDHKNAFAAYQRSFEIIPKPNPLYGMAVATKNMKDHELATKFTNMYVNKFGSDDRIRELIAELSENELSEKINNDIKQASDQSETNRVPVSDETEKSPGSENKVPGEPAKKMEAVSEKTGATIDVMRRFGKLMLLLLDTDTREAGYAAMEKIEHEYPEAAICLGQYYNGVDQVKAKKHIQIAADAGIAEGLWSYSQLLPHSHILDLSDPNDKEYLRYCLAAAEGGCPDAANEMGNICHRKGFYEESTYWYGMAYELEHPDGLISIKSITKKWLQNGVTREFRALTGSFTEERRATAFLILELFTQPVIDKTLDDLMKLALKGENLAGFLLAEVFEKNNHDDMAYKVYNALAFENHPHALRCYADMLLAGKGTARDVEGAFRFYEQAALAGNAVSMFAMGQKAFKDGDKYLAACWFGQAYSRGMDMAGEWLSNMA